MNYLRHLRSRWSPWCCSGRSIGSRDWCCGARRAPWASLGRWPQIW